MSSAHKSTTELSVKNDEHTVSLLLFILHTYTYASERAHDQNKNSHRYAKKKIFS